MKQSSLINIVEDNDDEGYLINLLIEATIYAYFNTLNSNNKWLLDSKESLHKNKHKKFLTRIEDSNISYIRMIERLILHVLR